MNPNAPEHQPGVASDESIITAFAEKVFSDPDHEAATEINKSMFCYNVLGNLISFLLFSDL